MRRDQTGKDIIMQIKKVYTWPDTLCKLLDKLDHSTRPLSDLEIETALEGIDAILDYFPVRKEYKLVYDDLKNKKLRLLQWQNARGNGN
jgi:hypothetical protein